MAGRGSGCGLVLGGCSEGVYAAYAWAHPDKGAAPRCDRMPEVFRAEAGKATGYECQILLGECSDGAWRLKWVNQPVWIGGEGRVEFGEPEPVSQGASSGGVPESAG